jgi:hypothetical protein
MSGRYRHERFEGALTVGANGSNDERMERPSISSKKNPASYPLAGLAARWNVHTKSYAFSGEAVADVKGPGQMVVAHCMNRAWR